jgi:hypothetical protein
LCAAQIRNAPHHLSGVALSKIGDMAEATDLERAPAIARTNGETVQQYNCAPTDAMYKAQASDPVWIDSSLPPADWVPPK